MAMAGARRRPRATLYLQSDGTLAGGRSGQGPKVTMKLPTSMSSSKLSEKKDEGSDDKTKDSSDKKDKKDAPDKAAPPKLVVGHWHAVTLAVDADAGTLDAFVDGARALALTGLDGAELRLQHRLTVFGGGNQAQARGGGVRRVLLHARLLGEDDAKALALTCTRDNAELVGCATRIEALGRGGIARRRERERREKEKAALEASPVRFLGFFLLVPAPTVGVAFRAGGRRKMKTN